MLLYSVEEQLATPPGHLPPVPPPLPLPAVVQAALTGLPAGGDGHAEEGGLTLACYKLMLHTAQLCVRELSLIAMDTNSLLQHLSEAVQEVVLIGGYPGNGNGVHVNIDPCDENALPNSFPVTAVENGYQETSYCWKQLSLQLRVSKFNIIAVAIVTLVECFSVTPGK